ncbi:amino acid ABC transporter membrane protein 1, PAAT family [Salinihabitans flavidus]|uniref:Amino acid ABC transporter membrane protein 1, PAAT family n=1 Tax=Salinihabitans flavidus TaxID=569882 RepID=A0A1H8TM01_9RHOB|nr:ABC transporter permease subunit [Salinihabitans flavidus]SEO91593.1 amino acid ABC transporter membrane protein 1, PAAT family [Salinihabitans flavidus]
MLLQGTFITIQLALLSLVLGLVFGLLGAAMKLSPAWPLRLIAGFYTAVLRGVPELVVILFVYFGGVLIVNAVASTFGYDRYIDVSAFAAGVTALSLTFGAYATEIFRGAVMAVPKGQIEAARACGMSPATIGIRILLPQVWRFALPGLGNTFLIILKETALVSVIGLDELMRKTEIAVGYTKKPFTFFLAAAFIYLALTVVVMAAQRGLEARANRGVAGRARA